MYRIQNQSTFHKDSDWTSSRANEFYLKLRASRRMRLKKCIWRSASEETNLKKSSWRHVIRSNGHQKHLTRSYFTRVDIVRCTKCTTTNSATTIFATLSLHQDKDNSNIAAGRHCFFSNGMDLKLVLHRTNIKSGKRSMVKNQSFKQDKLM